MTSLLQESMQETTKMYAQAPCLVLQVVPPRTASSRDIAALETVMQGLALNTRHPVALEIARTESGRQFLVRATSRAALEHLAAQIQARYPQAIIQPVSDDPLMLKPGEMVTAIELRPGAASYLPLRAFRERELPTEGTDPLLGLLAAMSHVPATMRVVTQLALLPLPPTWSQADRRRAVEHPLEPERLRQRRGMATSGSTAPGAGAIIGMGVLVAFLLLWYRFSRRLPPWMLRAGTLLLHGKNPHLSSLQMTELMVGLAGFGILALLLVLGVKWVLQRFGRTSIYDMRLVAEKTGRSAYRARLRLVVIDSGEERTQSTMRDAAPSRYLPSFLLNPSEFTLTGILSAYRHWRQATLLRRERTSTHSALLERLTAAYRQYHLAAGGYFVPHALSQAKARRVLARRSGLAHVFSGWAGDLRRSRHILSVADVAVLWHLPQTSDLAELPLLEFALKTLADANLRIVGADLQHGPDRQYTLLDVVPLLRNSSFRHAVMEQVHDPVLLSWWQYYYEPMDLRFQMEVISSVLNKLSKFASSRTTRRILGQPRSTINFTEILRSGKILLVSTASGVVGADVSALLGATLMGLFHVTLAEQAEVERAERRQYLALIDEFQVYQGADFGTMLAGLRKYGGSFGLATQSLSYLDRLERTLRSTVLSNVDHLCAFAMSSENARMLHELDGIAEDDITNLDDFTCYAKVSLGGRRLPVFSLRLDPPAIGNDDLAQRIRFQSQRRFARPCDAVDAMIAHALKRSAPPTLSTYAVRTVVKGKGKTEETEEGGQNSALVVQHEPPSAIQTAKSGRKKHRGSGKESAGTRQDQPLSLPLVYEQREAEGLED